MKSREAIRKQLLEEAISKPNEELIVGGVIVKYSDLALVLKGCKITDEKLDKVVRTLSEKLINSLQKLS